VLPGFGFLASLLSNTLQLGHHATVRSSLLLFQQYTNTYSIVAKKTKKKRKVDKEPILAASPTFATGDSRNITQHRTVDYGAVHYLCRRSHEVLSLDLVEDSLLCHEMTESANA